jgi:hypothetical protein
MVFEVAGPTLVRIGRWPKRALLYRTEEPFAKVATPWFGTNRVEVLGAGQQIVCFGVHPETGRPYEWRPHPPVRRADLPVLTEVVARHIVAEAGRIMREAGWVATQDFGKTHTFPLLVATATSDELSKPIYLALLKAMPLPKVQRRHQRWASSILRKLVALSTGRNVALCGAVIEFRDVIAQGLITPDDMRSLLVMACAANGYAQKVGIGQVHAIISSMLQPPKGGRCGVKPEVSK